MPTIPNVITPLPTPVPTSLDPVSFDTRADAFLAAQPVFAQEVNQAAQATYTNAQESAVSAENAASSADAAALTAGANAWNAATDYATNSAAISPTDSQTYRRLAPGGVDATDPALSASWKILGGVPLVSGLFTSAARMPAGNNAQRPATPDVGHTRINTQSAAGLRFMEFWDGVQWVPTGWTNPVPVATSAPNSFDVYPVPANVKSVELMVFDLTIANGQNVFFYISDDGLEGSLDFARNRTYGVSTRVIGAATETFEMNTEGTGGGGSAWIHQNDIVGGGILTGKIRIDRYNAPNIWNYEYSLSKVGPHAHLLGSGRFRIIGTEVLGRLRLWAPGSVATSGSVAVSYRF